MLTGLPPNVVQTRYAILCNHVHLVSERCPCGKPLRGRSGVSFQENRGTLIIGSWIVKQLFSGLLALQIPNLSS